MHPTHSIPKLEAEIDALSNALAKLSDAESFKELIRIIHFPGYTTPAEWLLVTGIVESMTVQARALEQLKGNLIAGSRAIVEGAKEQ